jgi:hypothetical protein
VLVSERAISAVAFFLPTGAPFLRVCCHAIVFFDTVLPWRKMDSFPGDYYGYKCHSGKKSSDIFNDYLDLLDGVLAYDEYEINWQLTNDATTKEFESW